jgi:hypothetical protein
VEQATAFNKIVMEFFKPWLRYAVAVSKITQRTQWEVDPMTEPIRVIAINSFMVYGIKSGFSLGY